MRCPQCGMLYTTTAEDLKEHAKHCLRSNCLTATPAFKEKNAHEVSVGSCALEGVRFFKLDAVPSLVSPLLRGVAELCSSSLTSGLTCGLFVAVAEHQQEVMCVVACTGATRSYSSPVKPAGKVVSVRHDPNDSGFLSQELLSLPNDVERPRSPSPDPLEKRAPTFCDVLSIWLASEYASQKPVSTPPLVRHGKAPRTARPPRRTLNETSELINSFVRSTSSTLEAVDHTKAIDPVKIVLATLDAARRNLLYGTVLRPDQIAFGEAPSALLAAPEASLTRSEVAIKSALKLFFTAPTHDDSLSPVFMLSPMGATPSEQHTRSSTFTSTLLET